MKSPKEKPSGTQRPDWKKRQLQNAIMGAVKMFVGVVVFGVIVGLAIVYKDRWMPYLFGKPEEKVVQAPPPPPAPMEKIQPKVEPPPPIMQAPPPPPIEKKAPPAAVIPVLPTGEEAIAKKLIDQGRSALENFEFDKAKSFFREAATKRAGTLKDDAATWEKKVDAFATATKHIDVAEFAVSDAAYIIEMNDGQEFRGLKIAEPDDKLKFQSIPPNNPASTGQSIMTIDVADIRNRVALSKQQRHDEFIELLSKLESSVTVQRSTDYYDLVFLSKRLGLGHECIEYLNRAFTGGNTHPADPYVGDSFRKEVIRRCIDRASLMLAAGRPKHLVESELSKLLKTLKGYSVAEDEVEAFRRTVMAKIPDNFKSTITLTQSKPATQVAAAKTVKNDKAGGPPAAPQQSARQLTDAEDTSIEVSSTGVQGHGAAAGIVDQANSKYEEGMRFYRGFKQGSNGDNNKNLRAALKLLDEAVDLYDQALQKDPSNKAIVDRQTEASMVAYGCRKYQTL